MARKKPPFDLMDHTADIGVLAYGPTLARAFENAALGMFSIMADLSTVSPAEERRVEVGADDHEALLVEWLTELLYLSDVEGMLFCRFTIDEMDSHPSTGSGRTLRGGAWGEKIDPERQALGTGVKAVTRHMLSIKRETDGYRLRVIFDI